MPSGRGHENGGPAFSGGHPPLEVKVVVVGDGAVGKTCLCSVFVTRAFPDDYEPTVFENHSQTIQVGGRVSGSPGDDAPGQAELLGSHFFWHTNSLLMWLFQEVSMQLWDTAGQEGFERIRTLTYENTSCFVICFSVADSVSFANVKAMWLDEVRNHRPEAKVLLVGTKADLRGATVLDKKNPRTKEVRVLALTHML